ncbi:molybdopterin-dependent oxidoreductase [Desulfonatronospira sp.]|uniref:molybdopterin-containing oxidoreductase family protein n=1 Tax=Desulfonatronospira sp. TaxID=1962951 RepID=UPI0025BA8578|nr:molybdopterin-dependent oxidoreductase [Desulfonatronospira sp.]
MIVHTVCRFCSACCPVEARVESGRLVSAQRKSFLPPAERINCPRLMRAPEIVYSKKRLHSPLIRQGKKESAKFRQACWDEALDLVGSKFLQHRDASGPESIAWLRGMAADWGTPWDYAQRLMNAFGSPNSIGNGSVCHVAREMAHLYTYGAMTMPGIKDSNCVLIWGKNDRNTMPGAFEALLHARKNGARLIVVDPVRTPAAAMADIHLQVKPAHDGMLAMAMMHEIITSDLHNKDFIRNYTLGFDALDRAVQNYPPQEIAPLVGLDTQDIKKAARLYAGSSPACIVDGNGLDMQLHTFQATRAVAMLRAITGNLDIFGGDIIPQPPRIHNIQLRDRLSPDTYPVTRNYNLFNTFHPNWGLHAQSCLVDAMLDKTPYSVNMVVVQSGNPVVTMADSSRVQKAFESLDFMVVIDPFFTRTAEFADVILPASMCFEKTQLNRASLRTSPVILQDQAIEPLPGTWPDWKIIFALAEKLGLKKEFPWHDVQEAIDFQLEPSGITVEKLRNSPQGIRDGEQLFEKHRTKGFNTPSGKVEFFSHRLEQNGHDAVPYQHGRRENPISFSSHEGHALVGMSGERENRFTHTQFHHVDRLLKSGEKPSVDLHEQDAGSLGITAGDMVRVHTPRGSIKLQACVTDRVRPGHVIIAWGWGEVHQDYNLNLLTDDHQRDPVTSTPSNRSFMCSLEKIRV